MVSLKVGEQTFELLRRAAELLNKSQTYLLKFGDNGIGSKYVGELETPKLVLPII